MSSSRDPLDELFDAYPKPPPMAADFKAQVQHRVATEAPVSRLAGWWHVIDRMFAQPAFATMFVCACVLLGLLVAEIQTGAERSRTHARVVQSYLSLINPRVDEGPVSANANTPAEVRP